MSAFRPLSAGFENSVERFAQRPALQIKDTVVTYAELAHYARSIAATLQSFDQSPAQLTGIFGHRSIAAFAGVLSGLLCGGAYVPLNPAFPEERTLEMIQRARLKRIIVEQDSLEKFLPVLARLPDQIFVVVPDAQGGYPGAESCPQHQFIGADDMLDASEFKVVVPNEDELAYLLFTSGSTGQPKGVMVKQGNVNHFVDYMVERYDINEHDRFSQTFDLTFDLSAFDMFVAWQKGACLCVPTQGEKMLPAKYVQSQQITIWFSVPSTAIMMKKLRMLKAGAFPSIRYSLFCGEALPLEVTESFRQAAPNSIVENLYGPTELTIACTLYRYDPNVTPREAEQGVVPIGSAFPCMEVLITDDNQRPVPDGEAGELLMTGPQLTMGYWEDQEKTAAAFVVPPGSSEVFYRTGDRVRRSGPKSPLLYLGRVDNQIKVQGYRVELGEIEALIRDEAKTDVAIAEGYPEIDSGAEGIIAFMSASDRSEREIITALAARLPAYMQPRQLITVNEFPLNANGKVDRRALMESFLSSA